MNEFSVIYVIHIEDAALPPTAIYSNESDAIADLEYNCLSDEYHVESFTRKGELGDKVWVLITRRGLFDYKTEYMLSKPDISDIKSILDEYNVKTK